MAKKGAIAEIFSKALHHDRPDIYLVGYVDLGTIKEVNLPDFLILSENFELIPATRITYIKKGAETLYSKHAPKKDHDMIGKL